MPRQRNYEVRRRSTAASWERLAPLPAAPLTAAEVLVKRLELAEEMLGLVLRDDAPLAAPARRRVRRLYESVLTVRQDLSASPRRA